MMNNLQRIQPPVFPVEKVVIPEAKSFRLNNGNLFMIEAGTEDIMRLNLRSGQARLRNICHFLLQHAI
jgi:hypothetical protein